MDPQNTHGQSRELCCSLSQGRIRGRIQGLQRAKGAASLCRSHTKLEHDPELKVSVLTSKDQCKARSEIIKISQ